MGRKKDENQQKWRTIIRLCLLFLLLRGFVAAAAAAEEKQDSANKNGFQFTMEAHLPENQIDPSKTYFDLRVEPGQVQDLQVDLINLTKQPLTLHVYATTAVTNNNGAIDYTLTEPELNPTLQHPFSEIAKINDPEVVLAGGEKKVVNIQLTVPQQPFNGEILGGIYVEPQVDDQQSGKVKDKKGKITTLQTMVKGVRLTENDTPVTPKLEMLEAHAGQIGYRNVFQALLQNPEPVMIQDLSIQAEVYQKGRMSKVLYENKSEHLRMAPNSSFNYSVPLKSALFTPGDYVMKLSASDGKQTWEFEQDLNVTVIEAERLNKQIPPELRQTDKKVSGWQIWLLVILGLFIIGVGVWLFLLVRRRKSMTASLPKKTKKKK